jgi:hypothetical protein
LLGSKALRRKKPLNYPSKSSDNIPVAKKEARRNTNGPFKISIDYKNARR